VPHPGHEHFVPDLVTKMNKNDLKSLAFSMSTYQQFNDDAATAVLMYAEDHLGLIMWNLGPGQQNYYHLHPTTEHLHVVVEGEVEYTLDGEAPFILKVGEAVNVPAGVAHGIRNLTDQPASYIAIASIKSGPYEKVLVERP
ncbi:MAG TPA: cupin domain-containing protein, partial [Acidimicrobiales bacterium]|nr:cupin domain-containing protein [Acidimicrobiales bacterium]